MADTANADSLNTFGAMEAERTNNNEMVKIMKNQKLKVFGLAALLIVGTLAQTACGNSTTLDKVGFAAVNIAQAVEDQVLALEAAGVPAEKLARLKTTAKALKASTKSLKDALDRAKTINEKDAAELTAFIAQSVGIVGGLLQNPDVLGLGESSTLVKVLRWGSVVLNQLSLTLGVFFPPKPPGIAAASDGGKTVAITKIKIEIPSAPPEVKAILNK